jgi:hypothetical protein
VREFGGLRQFGARGPQCLARAAAIAASGIRASSGAGCGACARGDADTSARSSSNTDAGATRRRTHASARARRERTTRANTRTDASTGCHPSSARRGARADAEPQRHVQPEPAG